MAMFLLPVSRDWGPELSGLNFLIDFQVVLGEIYTLKNFISLFISWLFQNLLLLLLEYLRIRKLFILFTIWRLHNFEPSRLFPIRRQIRWLRLILLINLKSTNLILKLCISYFFIPQISLGRFLPLNFLQFLMRSRQILLNLLLHIFRPHLINVQIPLTLVKTISLSIFIVSDVRYWLKKSTLCRLVSRRWVFQLDFCKLSIFLLNQFLKLVIAKVYCLLVLFYFIYLAE